MPKEFIAPPNVHPARGFSHAVKVGNTIYVAGQGGIDIHGHVVYGGIEAQIDLAFQNLQNVLEAAGAKMTDVVRLNYYFVDIQDLANIGGAYRKHFGKHFPASTAVQIGALAVPGMRVEVEATAVIG
ncbi:MAG: RidA family protein [Chloroflexi bacterium]|nr:RidA family protein [Chloroflexota bacterium]